jgi:hypothetical protein
MMPNVLAWTPSQTLAELRGTVLVGFGGFAGEKHLLDAHDRRTRWLTLIGS